MKPKILLLVFIFSITASLIFLDYSRQYSPEPATVAAFSFRTVDENKPYDLINFKNQLVLVNFWASWCAPCLQEFPVLVKLAQTHPDDFVLIMLSVDDNAEIAYNYAHEFGVKNGLHSINSKKLFTSSSNIFVGLDENKKISKNIFKTFMYPESYIIGKNLVVERKITGVISQNDIEYIERRISANIVNKQPND